MGVGTLRIGTLPRYQSTTPSMNQAPCRARGSSAIGRAVGQRDVPLVAIPRRLPDPPDLVSAPPLARRAPRAGTHRRHGRRHPARGDRSSRAPAGRPARPARARATRARNRRSADDWHAATREFTCSVPPRLRTSWLRDMRMGLHGRKRLHRKRAGPPGVDERRRSAARLRPSAPSGAPSASTAAPATAADA